MPVVVAHLTGPVILPSRERGKVRGKIAIEEKSFRALGHSTATFHK
jgi:hypothetical protein